MHELYDQRLILHELDHVLGTIIECILTRQEPKREYDHILMHAKDEAVALDGSPTSAAFVVTAESLRDPDSDVTFVSVEDQQDLKDQLLRAVNEKDSHSAFMLGIMPQFAYWAHHFKLAESLSLDLPTSEGFLFKVPSAEIQAELDGPVTMLAQIATAPVSNAGTAAFQAVYRDIEPPSDFFNLRASVVRDGADILHELKLREALPC